MLLLVTLDPNRPFRFSNSRADVTCLVGRILNRRCRRVENGGVENRSWKPSWKIFARFERVQNRTCHFPDTHFTLQKIVSSCLSLDDVSSKTGQLIPCTCLYYYVNPNPSLSLPIDTVVYNNIYKIYNIHKIDKDYNFNNIYKR